MSKYTTELRFPIEQRLKDLGMENLEENWPSTYDLLGLSDYPIFDEAYRSTLNDKIIRRYYFREIGFETMAHFRWMMRRTMHEIMPYYNQLYQSQELVTDPLKSYGRNFEEHWDKELENRSVDTESSQTDVKSETSNESSGRTTNNSSGTTSNTNVFQDTPMNMLDGADILELKYATNYTRDDGISTDLSEGTSSTEAKSGTESTTALEGNRQGTFEEGSNGNLFHREDGFNESQSELLLKYRKTFINIDMEILDRLNDLFMGLW